MNCLDSGESINARHKFIASVIIACCSLECHVSRLKQEEFVYPLLRMLRIQPNVGNLVCPNVSFLLDIIGEDEYVRYVDVFVYEQPYAVFLCL